MARFFIDRPIFAWVIALFIIVLGAKVVKPVPWQPKSAAAPAGQAPAAPKSEASTPPASAASN